MTVTREMTIMEINVLNAIKNSATYDLPIQARELRQHLGLSKRPLEEVIENLRVIYKQPIVAKKKQPSGYYLPRNEEERNDGLAPYKRQILTEQNNLAAIMSVNLEEYWAKEKT
ncbi:hypothetical protein [Streptococcus iniae]|uniref:hypothetical protein n=1 Tax=Streptococcus iniae TaxID=1346 RepID=UPI0003348069|nr:hypothetical protein [Streptococcus iniae]AGM99818.1 hypothetical protein K710_2076 [Streptococcus iniae SF1]QBX25757.1 hypothetical protein Javan272_0008 [Streptococcus phage Javan272]ASL35711.1 phage protein [Streptococcus iniae]ELY5748911.1 hypothetical protein [Streptococcus iniae]ELY5750845.1 hypothetical protein [Streptococcus iniae]